jgi:hypothetical protein
MKAADVMVSAVIRMLGLRRCSPTTTSTSSMDGKTSSKARFRNATA